MAQSTTPRLGLTVWSSDMDQHPGRPGTNNNHETLDRLVAVWAGQGLLSARGTPQKEGRIYVSTNVGDGGQASIDLGNRWLELSVLGGGGAPPAPAIGGAGSEGVSSRAMRSDARIPLPLATANNHGALASQHFELLESATAGGTPWSVPIRDGSGRIRLGGNGANAMDAVTKSQLDNLGNWEDIPNTVAKRGSDGTFYVTDPTKPANPVTLRYLNGRLSRAEYKTDVTPMTEGIDELCGLHLNWWRYRDDAPANGDGAGPMVEDVHAVAPRMTVPDEDGAPERIRQLDAIWWVAHALQQVEERRAKDQRKIRRLESTVADLVRIVNDLTPDDEVA